MKEPSNVSDANWTTLLMEDQQYDYDPTVNDSNAFYHQYPENDPTFAGILDED